jgi:hypothetical protein
MKVLSSLLFIILPSICKIGADDAFIGSGEEYPS